MPEGKCKPNYGKQDFFLHWARPVGLHWAMGFILLIIKKNPLRNKNSPITDPITKMGVAHAFELYPQICTEVFSVCFPKRE